MQKFIKMIFFNLFFLSLIWPSYSSAWNANAHVVISELAYQQLTPTTQKKVKALSDLLFKQLPFSTQYELTQKYPNTTTFSKISVLPDQYRKQPLKILFEQHQGALPSRLKFLAEENTRDWHFIDRHLGHSECVKKSLHTGLNQGQKRSILFAIHVLEPILKDEANLYSQALALAMWTHFMEDIHQPLHTFSGFNSKCQSDQGGNLFCLSKNPKYAQKRCKNNLHHLWDTGVGFLKGKQTHLSRKIHSVTKAFPASKFEIQFIQETNPSKWIEENAQYAKFIYSFDSDPKFRKVYYQKGQEIAKYQMALAGYRLAYALNAIWSE